MSDRQIPLLKVRACGEYLIPGSSEGARQPDDDGWWNSVLDDPRARVPQSPYISKDSYWKRYRLESQPNGKLYFGCPSCGWRDIKTKDALRSAFPADTNIQYVAKRMATCGWFSRESDGHGCRAQLIEPTKSGRPFDQS